MSSSYTRTAVWQEGVLQMVFTENGREGHTGSPPALRAYSSGCTAHLSVLGAKVRGGVSTGSAPSWAPTASVGLLEIPPQRGSSYRDQPQGGVQPAGPHPPASRSVTPPPGPALRGSPDRDAVLHLRSDWDAGRPGSEGSSACASSTPSQPHVPSALHPPSSSSSSSEAKEVTSIRAALTP